MEILSGHLTPRPLAPESASSGSAATEDTELREAARQFEALFVEMMLRSMREASPGDPMFGGGEMETYRDLHDREVARSMASGRGLGLADLMVGQLRQSQLPAAEAAAEPPDPAVADGAALPRTRP